MTWTYRMYLLLWPLWQNDEEYNARVSRAVAWLRRRHADYYGKWPVFLIAAHIAAKEPWSYSATTTGG